MSKHLRMRVQFDYTIEDLVDVQMRVLNNSRAVRAWRWRDLVLTSLMTGIFVFAIIPEEITVRIIVGIIGLILGAVLYPVVSEMTIKRRLRKWCEENAGPAKTFTCEVELNESGIHSQQNETQIVFPWKNMKEIRETKDSVDIYFERGGLMVIRNRAFTSPEERQRFIELAKQYSKMAQASRL
jgi:hypothetical protein